MSNRWISLEVELEREAKRQEALALIKTAWDAAADWWWVDAGYGLRVKGGKVLWEDAVPKASGKVLLRRLKEHTLHQINRWVDGDTPVELVKYEKE